jgi:hypothetical protein
MLLVPYQSESHHIDRVSKLYLGIEAIALLPKNTFIGGYSYILYTLGVKEVEAEKRRGFP